MCGIYGYFGKIKKGKEKEVFNLMKNLAIETVSRGEHSAGFFATNDKKRWLEKMAVHPTVFVERTKLMKKAIMEGSYVFIGHNRQASVGQINVANAHPFKGRKFVLVHNGTSKDVKKKFIQRYRVVKEMKGTTDSEGILRIIDKIGIVKKSFLKKLDEYSLVIFDKESELLYFARDPGRPMIISDFKKRLGIRIFVSTEEILFSAMVDTYGEKAAGMADDIEVFSTRPYHLYIANWKKKEINNKGRYKKVERIRRGRIIETENGELATPNIIDRDSEYWRHKYEHLYRPHYRRTRAIVTIDDYPNAKAIYGD